jgi:hypothetical protein
MTPPCDSVATVGRPEGYLRSRARSSRDLHTVVVWVRENPASIGRLQRTGEVCGMDGLFEGDWPWLAEEHDEDELGLLGEDLDEDEDEDEELDEDEE